MEVDVKERKRRGIDHAIRRERRDETDRARDNKTAQEFILLNHRQRCKNSDRMAHSCGFGRQDYAGLRCYASIMLDTSVALKIKNRFLAENCRIEVAIGDDQFVLTASCSSDNFSIRIDDDASGDHGMAILNTALCNGHDPGQLQHVIGRWASWRRRQP